MKQFVPVKDKLEGIRVLNKQQSHINDHFMSEQSFMTSFTS